MKFRLTIVLIFFHLILYGQNTEEDLLIKEKNYKPVLKTEVPSGGFTMIEREAMYPNGKEGINQHIMDNLQYPKKAYKKGIQGVVSIRYVVQADGTVDEIKVLKSVHPLIDKEAVRVIMAMDKWLPTIQLGKPVKSAFTQNMNFKI